MLNFFSRSAADDGTVYRFRDPSSDPASASGAAAERRSARSGRSSATRDAPRATEPRVMPTNYGDIVAFFRRTVAERKSPYNQLCRAADQLKDYIPDEISRLKVAWKMLGDAVSAEALSLAISTHLNDIDLARQKAQRHTPEMVAGETRRLKQEIAAGQTCLESLQEEIRQTRSRLQSLEATEAQEGSQLKDMREQLQNLQSSVNSPSFLDQAAQNEKNDLLARKVLLGLE